MQQRFHEGTIHVPHNWVDETLTVLRAPQHEGHNLVVSREPLPRGVDAAIHLETQRGYIANNLDDFQEVKRDVIPVAGVPCIWLEYSWSTPEGLMFQGNLMRIVANTVVSFTFTSPRPFTALQSEEIRTMLGSFVPAPEMEKSSHP